MNIIQSVRYIVLDDVRWDQVWTIALPGLPASRRQRGDEPELFGTGQGRRGGAVPTVMRWDESVTKMRQPEVELGNNKQKPDWDGKLLEYSGKYGEVQVWRSPKDDINLLFLLIGVLESDTYSYAQQRFEVMIQHDTINNLSEEVVMKPTVT